MYKEVSEAGAKTCLLAMLFVLLANQTNLYIENVYSNSFHGYFLTIIDTAFVHAKRYNIREYMGRKSYHT